jgi:hypothetical protein
MRLADGVTLTLHLVQKIGPVMSSEEFTGGHRFFLSVQRPILNVHKQRK